MHKEVSSLYNLDIYTEKGIYIGKIGDIEFEINEKKIVSIGANNLNQAMFDANESGVKIPFRWVKVIGDIVIIRHLFKSFKKNKSVN